MTDPNNEPGPGTSTQGVPGPGPTQHRRTPIGPRILGGVILALGLFLLSEAYKAIGDEELSLTSPRLAPLIVTGLWVLFAAIYLVRQIVSPTRDYPEPTRQEDNAEAASDTDAQPGTGEKDKAEVGDVEEDSVHTAIDWRTPTLVAVLLVAYALLLEPVGFVLSTAVFYLGVSRVLGSRKLIRDIVVAVCLSIGVYAAFTQLLDIFLPSGVLPL